MKNFPIYGRLLRQDSVPIGVESVFTDHLALRIKGWFWPGTPVDEPDVGYIEQQAAKLPDHTFLCVDIEMWNRNDPDTNEVVRKHIVVCKALRTGNPTLRIGWYGPLPWRDYWNAIKDSNDSGYQKWVDDNEALDPIADYVDVVFPSLYHFYPRPHHERNRLYTFRNMMMAKRWGKPVYPFLMPYYHPAAKPPELAWTGQPCDEWLDHLWDCYNYADGVVLYANYRATWNEADTWWPATLGFIERINRSK